MNRARARAGFCALSAASAAIFGMSPVRNMSDSRYSLLVADNLLRHGELALDRYFEAPRRTDAPRPVVAVRSLESASSAPRRLPLPDYAVARAGNGRLHYFFPHAGSVLALPYVAALRALGFSTIADGRYSARAERRLQAGLAAIVMGLATGLFYLTAIEFLPPPLSVAVALVGALGTQVWSTASRVLWSDTWGVALLACVVWLLARNSARGRPLNAVVLGSLLAWMYFVRPTNSVHAGLVLAYLAVAHRALLPRVVATGALWGAAFVAYSYRTFGMALPPYFQAGRLGTGYAVESLLANLVSPSRGLVFFAPVVPLALFGLWRYRRQVSDKPLARLAVAGVAAQFVPLLFFDHWWGGHSYGPRLLTGMVPWAVLVSILALQAAHAFAAQVNGRARRSWAVRAAVVAICAWSVIVNGRGAVDASTRVWDAEMPDVDDWPLRVWDWRRPQFLAGLGGGHEGPLPLRVWYPLGQAGADRLFRDGWSAAERDVRWSVSERAALRVRWPMAGPLLLQIRLRAAPRWLAVGGQPLVLSLDGRELGRWHLTTAAPDLVQTPVEADGSERPHRLELHVPGPAPAAQSDDERALRTGVHAVRLDPLPVLPRGERLLLGQAAAARFLGGGWGDPEGAYRWTVAPEADLFFADLATDAAVLRFRLHPFLANVERPGQRVQVGLNGTLVGTLALQSEEASEHAIAVVGGRARANTLRFELPDAATTAASRTDPRHLGVALHWLRLDAFPVLVRGQAVTLGHADAARYLGDGWAEPEGRTRWSMGTTSEVFFKVDTPGPGRLLLTVEPFLSRRHRSQRVRVDLNDRRLAELVLDRPGAPPHEIEVPAGVVQTFNVLRLIFPDARSPASLGLSADRRLLAVRVGTLELR